MTIITKAITTVHDQSKTVFTTEKQSPQLDGLSLSDQMQEMSAMFGKKCLPVVCEKMPTEFYTKDVLRELKFGKMKQDLSNNLKEYTGDVAIAHLDTGYGLSGPSPIGPGPSLPLICGVTVLIVGATVVLDELFDGGLFNMLGTVESETIEHFDADTLLACLITDKGVWECTNDASYRDHANVDAFLRCLSVEKSVFMCIRSCEH